MLNLKRVWVGSD